MAQFVNFSTKLSSKLTTGDGRRITVGHLVDLYRNNVNLAVPSSGHIQRLGDNEYSIISNFSTVDCDVLESVPTFKVYSMTTTSDNHGDKFIEKVRSISDFHEVCVLEQATSLNGRFQAKLKVLKDSSDLTNKKQLLELWDRSRLLKTIKISELNEHGSIITEKPFNNFVWCPYGDQDKLLYVCAQKKPKHMSYTQEDSDSSKEPNRGEEYLLKEDWGESLVGIDHTIVGILDLGKNFEITTIDVEGYSLIFPQWMCNGTKILSTACQEEPRRLGLVYCNNRPTRIMLHDWRANFNRLVLELHENGTSYHNARVNNTGDKFIYLSNAIYGAHWHSSKISVYDANTRTSCNLSDTSTGISEFFIKDDLQKQCFTSDDRNILFVASENLHEHLCLFNLETQKLTRIKFPTTGVSILDFQQDIILASGSEVNATSTLFVATLSLSNPTGVVAWHQIEDCIHLDNIDYETHRITTPDNDFVNAILIKPNLKVLHENLDDSNEGNLINQDNDLPTLVAVHGGPHAAFGLFFLAQSVMFAKVGLKVLLINYRGSTGVNEAYSQSLCGRIGKLDIEDCLFVLKTFVEKGLINRDKLIIYGGSHGGFISCHLSCQDEFKFTSAIITNPVVDLSSLYTTSDIPDWAATESLGNDDYKHPWLPESNELVKMFECSPIKKVSKANVPTLLLLGTTDRRVPMQQGLLWYNALKARGVEIMCKVYTDRHRIGKVNNSLDSNITALMWILNHLPTK